MHSRNEREKETDDNQILCSIRFWCTSVFRLYFILIRVLNERTTLRIAVCGGLRRTRLGQLVFCLLERRRARPERSPSSSSDVQGTTPRDDVACINSWSGPFRCSYNRIFNVSSYIRASGNSTWKKGKHFSRSVFKYRYYNIWRYLCMLLIGCINDRVAADFCHLTTVSVKCPTAYLARTDNIFDK